MALSTVFLSGKSESEILKWATMYAKEREHRFPVPPTVQDVLDSNLMGDVGRVKARIEEWIAAGVDYVVIQPMLPIEGMRFFGEKVLPLFG